MSKPDTGEAARPLVAVMQYAPEHGAVAANVEMSLQKIANAASRGASVVVLPECCTTGLVYPGRSELFGVAETFEGSAVNAWRKTATELNIHLVAGMAEREGSKLFNSAITVSPDGSAARYRKAHVFGGERALFDLGDQLACVDTPWGRIGLTVCYDLWFPELTRALAKNGATLVASPANWFTPPRQTSDRSGASPMAMHLAIAAACSNEITVACADRTGQEGGVQFLGQSFIVGPNGRLLAGPASPEQDDCLIAEWQDPSATRAMVQSHMETRRDDLYSRGVATLGH
ncbi:hypothetical protein EN817_08330 [Mesorhizobium sp. M3A.F.Ca.ET.174.01.1.1]|uniref:nitrilase-related carbon-nitrogen hydrolase n=1 Tax=unclassified Mesorhizobium TaxID=325217 RepID=UPI0010935B9D|nr:MULTISPECIES: nitrilase-related carbon-nitrogen hydrolase [unclassified Mesorhizobium]TGS87416.1 hypothetical protein EN818_08330 [Mesorhizobium sp. M3A.F.Ca.ET.175.01.1.1]TGT27876.1 hypothetical protein EN817_08330 [Mesorhizobium sp. M3A.F.Ca.ET.174.01.1.1]